MLLILPVHQDNSKEKHCHYHSCFCGWLCLHMPKFQLLVHFPKNVEKNIQNHFKNFVPHCIENSIPISSNSFTWNDTWNRPFLLFRSQIGTQYGGISDFSSIRALSSHNLRCSSEKIGSFNPNMHWYAKCNGRTSVFGILYSFALLRISSSSS